MATYFTGAGFIIEDTAGTEKAVAAANHIELIGEPTISEAGPGPISVDALRPHLGGAPNLGLPSAYQTLSFKTQLKAPVAKGDALEISPLLRSAGFLETLVALTSSTYSMINDPDAAANIKAFSAQLEQTVDGRKFNTFGARAGFTINFSPDQQITFDWDAAGAYKRPVDLAALTSWTLNAGLAVKCMGDTTPCRIDAYDMILRGGKISWNLAPDVRPSMGAGSNNWFYKWPALLKKSALNPTVSFDVELEDEASHALYAKYEAQTSVACSLVFVSGTNTCTMAMPAIQLGRPQIKTGKPAMVTLAGTLSGSTALSIAFT